MSFDQEKIIPFSYFGGKRRVADVIWRRLGDVRLYIEPFVGGGAVLLLRPDSHQWWLKYEIINDIDGLLCNFWRAVKFAPDEVARFADYPTVECDLHARHLWLKEHKKNITDRLMADPEYYDAKVAGWWLWGIARWIGGRWCWGGGPWRVGINKDGERVLVNVHEKPDDVEIVEEIEGVFLRHPRKTGNNTGIYSVRKLSERMAHLSTEEICEQLSDVWTEYIKDVMRIVANRLRNVFVYCGDWKRVLPTDKMIDSYEIAGIFLDPPYNVDKRYRGIYMIEEGISDDVREWCIKYTDRSNIRIVLCGYAGEHDILHEKYGWSVYEWVNQGGYAHLGNNKGKDNRRLERIWFSPSCLSEDGQVSIDF